MADSTDYENDNVYLDAGAMYTRMQDIEGQNDEIGKVIYSTRDIMDALKSNFSGVSATRLQNKYNEVEETFNDFKAYLDTKLHDMGVYSGNITETDIA